jgi:hypothetical protein
VVSGWSDDGWELTVTRVEGVRITELALRRLPEAGPGAEAAPARGQRRRGPRQLQPHGVLVGVVLLLANGAFVAVEIALLAARRTRIEEAAEQGDPRAGEP